MIDYWLIFCLNILILTFAWHTFVGYLLNGGDKTAVGRADKVSSASAATGKQRDVWARKANALGRATILALIVAFNVVFGMSAVGKSREK